MRYLLFLAVMSGVITPAHADDSDTPLDTVPYVDLNQYLGTWHEIARLEHRFQKGCINSTADYSFRNDGDIRVVNRCTLEGKAKVKEAVGRAWVKDHETNAKLRVQFVLTGIKLGFLSGKYWILDLAPDYSHAIIGDPSRRYFWLLSRSPVMETPVLNALMEKAVSLGYNPSEFVFNQPWQPDP